MGIVTVGNSGILSVSGTAFGGSDDFSGYSVGAFPQDSDWSILQADAGWSSSIIASSTPFPNQNLQMDTTNGAGGSETLVYNPTGNFVDGTVRASIAFPSNTTNLQLSLVLQAADGNNLLEVRYRAQQAVGGLMYIIEKIAGVENNRYTSGALGLLINTEYVMELTTSGTSATGTIYQSDGMTVINGSGPIVITGGVSGKSGIRRVSAATTAAWYDNFSITA